MQPTKKCMETSMRNQAEGLSSWPLLLLDHWPFSLLAAQTLQQGPFLYTLGTIVVVKRGAETAQCEGSAQTRYSRPPSPPYQPPPKKFLYFILLFFSSKKPPSPQTTTTTSQILPLSLCYHWIPLGWKIPLVYHLLPHKNAQRKRERDWELINMSSATTSPTKLVQEACVSSLGWRWYNYTITIY